MANLELKADGDEFIESMGDLTAALRRVDRLPAHVCDRMFAMMRDGTASDMTWSAEDGVLRIRPSGEMLAVLALVRGHAARACR